MNKNTIRNIILVLFFYKLVLQNNLTSLLYSKTSIPTSQSSLNEISLMLSHIPNIKDYTFIDFGCGTGSVLLHVHDKVNKVIGIEIDPQISSIAKKNTSQLKNVSIKNVDMRHVTFPNEPTVLFLYEPLWDLDKSLAMPVYHQVFSNINNAYVIYISGVSSKYLDKVFFEKYGLKVIKEKSFGSLLLPREIYLLHSTS